MPWDHSPPGITSTKTKDSDKKYMKIEKYYTGFRIPKVWQVLEPSTESFHQA